MTRHTGAPSHVAACHRVISTAAVSDAIDSDSPPQLFIASPNARSPRCDLFRVPMHGYSAASAERHGSPRFATMRIYLIGSLNVARSTLLFNTAMYRLIYCKYKIG